MKKILKIILFIVFGVVFIGTQYCFAALDEQDVIRKAYNERREKMLELIGGGKLETEIRELKTQLSSIEIGISLDNDTKERILEEISNLEQEIANLNSELTANIEDASEFEVLMEKYNYEVNLKKDLVNQLNAEIKENEINYEKINLLIERYAQDKEKLNETNSKSKLSKIVLFCSITIALLLVHFISSFFSNRGKLNKKKYIYINFFIVFAYILFLIWFFFYLYPEFSVFLIFMSGYLLVINSHLIGSFIGSVIVLQRFKIGDIIKSGTIYGKISNISPLYIAISPITNEGILLSDKPIYVPHINILRDSISKDTRPELLFHTFRLTIKEDSGVDVMRFLSEIETNILQKFLGNKLKTIPRSEDVYRISFDSTNTGNIIIIFTWEGDNVLNNKVERKIVGHLSKAVAAIKKQKEDKAKEEQSKSEEKNLDNAETIRKNKQKEMENESI